MTDPTLLISRYFDEDLSDEEFADFSSWLGGDDENALLFVRRAMMEHHLCDCHIAEPGIDLNAAMVMPAIHERASEKGSDEDSVFDEHVIDPSHPPKSVAKRRFTWRIAAAAMLPLLLAAGAWLVLRSRPVPAVFATSVGANWVTVQPKAGARLPAGMLELRSGLAQVQFVSGASMIVEGPSRFRVRSDNAVELEAGRLTAIVPGRAHGFTVQTPSARIVDLGTEFGVSVEGESATHVQVFRGKVEVGPLHADAAAGAPQLLAANDIADVTAGGTVVATAPAQTSPFVRQDELDARAAADKGSSYQRWLAYSYQVLRDPDLVAYYTFDCAAEDSYLLVNRSTYGKALDGIRDGDDPSAGPTWTTGRWPQKGALAFATGSHQRVEVPAPIGGPLDFSRGTETASPFSICVWVDLNGSGNQEGIVAKGIGTFEQFAVETFADGCVRGWVRDTHSTEPNAPLQDLITKDKLNHAWEQVALIYRPESGRIEIYLNGVLAVARDDAPHELLENERAMIIGCREANGNSATASSDKQPGYFPSFPGRIDELAIFRRALSAEQIREMYAAGKPD